jgi:hypothetical protein
MTLTIRKCDFCGKEITTDFSCRTVIILKSHKDCVNPLSDKDFDICVNCMTKMLNCLSDNLELKEKEE